MKPVFKFDAMMTAADTGVPLDALAVATTARIVGVSARGDERTRLEAMGLCAGRLVEVVRAGDPMIVRVLRTRIGLAAALAARVQVERRDSSLADSDRDH